MKTSGNKIPKKADVNALANGCGDYCRVRVERVVN
jgi:hypothetical protein